MSKSVKFSPPAVLSPVAFVGGMQAEILDPKPAKVAKSGKITNHQTKPGKAVTMSIGELAIRANAKSIA